MASADIFEVQKPFTPVQWATVIGSLVVLLLEHPRADREPGLRDRGRRDLGGRARRGHERLARGIGFLIAIPGLLVAGRPTSRRRSPCSPPAA